MKRIFALILALMLLLCACGAEEAAPEGTTAPETQPGVVTVSTVEELLAAIVPGNTIELLPGEYRLDEAADYGKSESPYYTWEDLGLGWYGLQIQYVNGLTIRGAGKDSTNLCIAERMANVLNLKDCNDITISNMTLGHTEQTEACEGGVIHMENTDNSTLRSLGLYGCGTIGVQAWQCENITVEGCEIYDCSIGGVQISQCREVLVKDSDFHHLGKDEPVMHVFSISSSMDVEVADCTAEDNYVQQLIWADCPAVFRNNVFRTNRVSSAAFDLLFEMVVFDGNTFEENDLRNWYAIGSAVAVDGQGEKVQMETPESKPQEVTPGVATPVSTGEQKEVRVSNVEDFLKAIDSDTCILLDAKLLDFSQARSYKEAMDLEQMEVHQPKDNPNYYWINNYDGPSLIISGVSNLTIKAEGTDRKAHTLSAKPRYADVLTFENCSAITLEGFTAGHTIEPGYCTGGVFALNNCADVLIDNCGMYGCGTEGVNADASRNIQIVNSEIYECSYNGIVLWNSENVAISGTVIRDISNDWGEAPYYSFHSCRNVTLDGAPMDGNYVGN